MNSKHLSTLALCSVAALAQAQVAAIKPDIVEVKRIAAMATVQRLQMSARAHYDPQVKFSEGRECNFNIGDLASAQATTPGAARQAPRGVQRSEYTTVVNATPICVQR